MVRLETVLRAKEAAGGRVLTIAPDRTIHDAIEALVEQRVGSLVVVDAHEHIVGILTERDILREVNQRAGETSTRTVAEVMTRDLIIALPEDDLAYAMTIMTENRIRHLPILEDGRLRGMISIGDLVKAQLDHREVEVRMLHDYIEGRYPR